MIGATRIRQEDREESAVPPVLAAVRKMLPALRASQEESDRIGRPPAHIVKLLREAGVYGLTVPKKFGGVGADMQLWMDVVTELGRGNTAIAWAVTLGASANWTFSSFFPEALVREVYADPEATLSGVFSGRKLESRPVEGGIHIDEGTWFFNSGVYEATHDLLGVTLFDENGEPAGPGIALVSMDDVIKLDDWGHDRHPRQRQHERAGEGSVHPARAHRAAAGPGRRQPARHP